MTHDPLCPRPACDYGEPDGECMGYEDCWHRCVCDLIARVRADEREKAAQRIDALPHWTDGWPERVLAAVRGEAQ